MKCPHCGKEIADGSKVCPICGKQIEEKKRNGLLLLLLLLLLLAGIGCAVYFALQARNAQLEAAALQEQLSQCCGQSDAAQEAEPAAEATAEATKPAGKTIPMYNKDLNILYRGIENRVSIPAGEHGDITVQADGATVKKDGEDYLIKPTRDGVVRVTVSANVDGALQEVGSQEFKVKSLPDPKAFLAYKKEGATKRTQDDKLSLRVFQDPDTHLVAEYGADGLIKASFKITTFTMMTKFGMKESRDGNLTSEQRAEINKLRSGDEITFRSIKAVGPDGQTHTLNTVNITL